MTLPSLSQIQKIKRDNPELYQYLLDLRTAVGGAQGSSTASPASPSAAPAAISNAALSAHIADTETHGAIGKVVGTQNTQTLTNKTLSSPVITTPTGIVVSDIAGAEATVNKDASNGYTGLTLFKINFKNALNTFTSFLANSNTAARTYTFQDRNGMIADDTDLALKAPLASPALTGTPTAPTAVDNDSAFQIANDQFVKQQIGFDTGAHGKSQAINMTAAVSGGGIAVADNANLAFGTTTNVTLVWKGSLPVWGNTGTPLYLMHKFQDYANRWGVYVEAATSKWVFYLLGTGGATIVATSTFAFAPPNNSVGEICVSIVRETISTAGSVTFYWNGIQMGSVIAIPAGTPPSMTNTGTLYVLGAESAGRTAGAVQSAHIYNRTLSAADSLDKYRNGVNISDKWGNMTGPVNGCVMALEPEGINATNWTGSANGMNATYPAAGSSLVRYASSDIAAAMHASRIWFLN